MTIRRFRLTDARVVGEIFYRSVHEVACAKYDAAQVAAWAPEDPEPERWLERLSGYETFVAQDDVGTRVGWISMSDAGYVDMLFCLPEATRCGVADALYAAVEAIALARGLSQMTAHASLLAEPFFLRHGWSVERHESFVRNDVAMPRAAMSKKLRATDGGADRDGGAGRTTA